MAIVSGEEGECAVSLVKMYGDKIPDASLAILYDIIGAYSSNVEIEDTLYNYWVQEMRRIVLPFLPEPAKEK